MCRKLAEMANSTFIFWVSNNLSVIPRRLIGGLHEWRNARPTVPVLNLVNLLLGEHAGDS